jgi:hypothetical protein
VSLGEHLHRIPHHDISINEQPSDMSRCFPYYYYTHHHRHHKYLHRDIEEDRGITTKPISVIHTATVNGVKTHTDEEKRCLHYDGYPYGGYPYGGYPYGGYPYGGYPYGGYPYGGYPYSVYPHGLLDDDNDYRDISLDHPYHPPPHYPVVNPPVHPPIIHRDRYDYDNTKLSQNPYHRYTHG